jgi:hypothetical protein
MFCAKKSDVEVLRRSKRPGSIGSSVADSGFSPRHGAVQGFASRGPDEVLKGVF